MYSIAWLGADGVVWPLVAEETHGVFLERGGLDQVVGGREASPLARVGHRRHPGIFDGAVRPLEMSLALVCASHTSHGSHGAVHEVYRRFMRGCSETKPGALLLKFENEPAWKLECYARPLPPLQEWDVEEGHFRFTLGLVAPVGVWRSASPTQQTGSVLVANPGDVRIWPRIRWSGAGGRVGLPSGATFNLPGTETGKVYSLDLDPAAQSAVTDESGEFDEFMQHLMAGNVIHEGVPVGTERTYSLPAGATLVYELGVFNPMKEV